MARRFHQGLQINGDTHSTVTAEFRVEAAVAQQTLDTGEIRNDDFAIAPNGERISVIFDDAAFSKG